RLRGADGAPLPRFLDLHAADSQPLGGLLFRLVEKCLRLRALLVGQAIVADEAAEVFVPVGDDRRGQVLTVALQAGEGEPIGIAENFGERLGGEAESCAEKRS